MQEHIIAFQDRAIGRLQGLLNQLNNCDLITPTNRGDPDRAWQQQVRRFCLADRGIYVFYADENPQYVGRTDGMVSRIKGHRSMREERLPSNSATFARILAKDAFRRDHNRCEGLFSLQLTRSFNNQEENPQREIFLEQAIRRVRDMQVRVVEVTHPHDQTVFEVYVHEMLGTQYNSFRNH